MTEAIAWFEEGRKHFVASRVYPNKPPLRYPTQDVYTPKDEAEYISGYNAEKAQWLRGNGLGGLDGYSEEHDEQKFILVEGPDGIKVKAA